jgi:hypothetical protein
LGPAVHEQAFLHYLDPNGNGGPGGGRELAERALQLCDVATEGGIEVARLRQLERLLVERRAGCQQSFPRDPPADRLQLLDVAARGVWLDELAPFGLSRLHLALSNQVNHAGRQLAVSCIHPTGQCARSCHGDHDLLLGSESARLFRPCDRRCQRPKQETTETEAEEEVVNGAVHGQSFRSV